MFMSFIISLAVIIAINFLVTIVMGLVGAPLYLILIVSSMAIAFFFAMYYFRNSPEGRWRNPAFHKYFVTNFVFLLFINYLFNFVF